MIPMVRHILFWKLRPEIKAAGQADHAVQVLAASARTLAGIEGLRCAAVGKNLAGGPYDLIFYVELDDMTALNGFQDHPLYVAHRERCAPYITAPLAGAMQD